mgnify:CR=1 FL=1
MSGRVQIFHNKQITSPVNPLPVTVISGGGGGGLTDAELRATPVPVSATEGATRVGGTYDVGGQIIDEVPTVRTVNRAFVNASATGNTSLVAAQGSGVRIRVLGIIAVSTLANNVKFQSATTDISALFPLAANAGFVLPYNQHGWFQTAANEALNVNLSVATATGFQVIWVQAT